MKQLLYLPLLFILILNKASAQNSNNRYDLNINDASKHIGEYKIVKGVVDKVEIRNNKHNPDSAQVLFYLREAKNPTSYLVKIIRVNIKGNTPEANWFKKIKTGKVDYSEKNGDYDYWDAEGKIFLFEGKPAILIDFNDLKIIERVGG